MRALLFWRMEWCEEHPKLMLACIAAGVLIVGAL